jgi:hypothetical protein
MVVTFHNFNNFVCSGIAGLSVRLRCDKTSVSNHFPTFRENSNLEASGFDYPLTLRHIREERTRYLFVSFNDMVLLVP